MGVSRKVIKVENTKEFTRFKHKIVFKNTDFIVEHDKGVLNVEDSLFKDCRFLGKPINIAARNCLFLNCTYESDVHVECSCPATHCLEMFRGVKSLFGWDWSYDCAKTLLVMQEEGTEIRFWSVKEISPNTLRYDIPEGLDKAFSDMYLPILHPGNYTMEWIDYREGCYYGTYFYINTIGEPITDTPLEDPHARIRHKSF